MRKYRADTAYERYKKREKLSNKKNKDNKSEDEFEKNFNDYFEINQDKKESETTPSSNLWWILLIIFFVAQGIYRCNVHDCLNLKNQEYKNLKYLDKTKILKEGFEFKTTDEILKELKQESE